MHRSSVRSADLKRSGGADRAEQRSTRNCGLPSGVEPMAGQLLCGRGQETGHENDEGSSPQEEIGRNGGGHGLHVGLGGGKIILQL
jgi:hypothetical protein